MIRIYDSRLNDTCPNDVRDIFYKSKIMSRSVKAKTELKRTGQSKACDACLTNRPRLTNVIHSGACDVECVEHVMYVWVMDISWFSKIWAQIEDCFSPTRLPCTINKRNSLPSLFYHQAFQLHINKRTQTYINPIPNPNPPKAQNFAQCPSSTAHGVSSVRWCPHCAERGIEQWVISGKHCPRWFVLPFLIYASQAN